jgi:SAM-dependent methyltransferase
LTTIPTRLCCRHRAFSFEKICLIGREKVAKDLLDPAKALNQAAILERYCTLQGRKVLEIGSGLGVNHIVWTRKYGIDGYGVEPSEEGFDSSHAISKRLIARNGLDASRIVDCYGEALPFPNESFDIVYSTNVLEHTRDPEAVIREAFRVLRPNGVMQLVYPNYHSYFDGHYAVFHPPIFGAWFFPWYVKAFFGRGP